MHPDLKRDHFFSFFLLSNAVMLYIFIFLLNAFLSLSFFAVVLLNSKETQAELGWTSYPPNGVSLPSCIFHRPSVCLFACSLARLHSTAACLTAGLDQPPFHSSPLFTALSTFSSPHSTYLSFSLFLTPCIRSSSGVQLVIIINRYS